VIGVQGPDRAQLAADGDLASALVLAAGDEREEVLRASLLAGALAVKEVTTTETSAPLWRPGLDSPSLLRALAETMNRHRFAFAERLARAKACRWTVGQTDDGRYLRVIAVRDAAPGSIFVVTAYELSLRQLAAYR
jgi:hypothetical protein